MCRIGGQDLLTMQHWDLVDQLWAYLVEAITRIHNDEEYDAFFPDQPLRLRLVPLSDYCIEVTVGQDSKRFDRHTLSLTLRLGAQHFFKEMERLVPEHSETWDRYLKEAAALT